MSPKQLLLLLSFVLCVKLNAQTTAIPDANFEQRLIDLLIDTNGLNGNILNSDAQVVSNLTLTGNTISNFTGLEAFVNLVNLDLGNNSFATVPLSSLTLLETLKINDNDLLASLDVSQNVLLKIIDIESDTSLNVTIPSITTLDLSTNIALESLRINSFNSLSNVILPVTSTLNTINITRIADPTLDFSLISGLETLTISGSVVPVTITLPNVYTNLSVFTIQNIDIPIIDISNYINLEQINFSNTGVETLLLPNSSTLTRVTIRNHNLQGTHNFASLPNLDRLTITNNENTPLLIDVSQNLALTEIDLSSNDMTILDITQNVLLEQIDVSNNEFTTIDLTQNVLAENINVSSNNLPTLNVTQNVLLEYLYASNNLLPNLDVTNNVELRQLIISNNLFTTTGLDLTENVELNYIDISDNQVESLYILDNIKLVSFVADHNLFSGTDILDQLFIVKSGYFGVSASNLIDVSFNNLSGPMPNFASLVGTNANYFRFYFHNNAFEFGHFEDQHNQFVNFLTQTNTFGSVQLPIMTQYWYAPQAKVNTIDTINANAGDTVTLTTVVSGAQNHYVWFKDGVQIPGAPDSPNYVINSVNPCNQGVYYCEILSDLVPFENTNPPGTQGKNLKLTRNDITLNVTPATNSCPTLIFPLNGATNVPINPAITWADSPNACSYTISIGTTSGGTQILNNVNVGDVNIYNLTSNLPVNTQIFITITPNYQSGSTPSCTEQSFTTGTLVAAVPTCVTTMDYPAINAVNIPVNQNFAWIPVANATGYTVTLGTTPGGSQIAGTTNLVTNVFNPSGSLPEGQIVYLTIIPFNADGNAIGCSSFQFTVEINPLIPTCPVSYSIANLATNVFVGTGISWPAISSQTTYRISIGTSPGGTDFVNNFFLNTFPVYSSSFGPGPLAYSTIYYVTVTTENQNNGNQTTCTGFQFTTEAAPLGVISCTSLISPSSGSANVAINTNLTWNPATNASGYFISIGTTLGGTEILNNFDNGNNSTYIPINNFSPNTEYFVNIMPYNSLGNITNCNSESFTTASASITIPNCTTLVSPSSGSPNVAINSTISWNAVSNATGYFISIGTTSGGTNFVNNFDNGNSTTFNPTSDFTQNTMYFVTITPYNSAGNATSCASESFTTETIITIPNCTTLVSPSSGSTNVAINSTISWNAIANATGYFISIGTTSGGTNFVNNFDNGNSTTFNPTTDFAQNTMYFVTITPYNSAGNATSCASESFTTETIITIPNCTTLVSPSSGSTNVALNSTISWNAIANATGYFISIGTTSGGTNFVNNFDNGNSTTFNPTTDFAQNTMYFVTITPYNSAGNATSCASESFTTQTIVTIPNCTTLVSPSSGSTNVAINSNISWNAIANATGYFISYGTNNAANNIENMVDVGNTLSYNPPTNFPEQTQIYVVITPYNILGNATGCNLQYFDTETSVVETPKVVLFTPSFFTPNGDGFNDIWQIEDPKNEVKNILIFDRFGKLLKTIAGDGNWNGTFNNQKLVSDDYWFVIEKKTGELLKGHFSLKR